MAIIPTIFSNRSAGPDPLAPAPPRPGGLSEMPPATGALSDLDLMTMPELMSSTAMSGSLVPMAPYEHDANLAQTMDENDLSQIGRDLIEMIDADLASRKDWESRLRRGLEIIGIKEFNWSRETAPFEGASTVVHPMLVEAGTQSAARACEELLPAAGPAKAVVMGKEDDDKRDAADRVADHMNYQLTLEDIVYAKETHKLHLYNTWFGTAYRKAYHDPISDKNVLRFVRGDALILPYDASSLDTSPRITHQFELTANDLKKYQVAGAYRKVELQEPTEEEESEVEETIDDVDAKERVRADRDIVHKIYECDCTWDLPGFEDPYGIALPYTITLEKGSEKVLSIRRCWKESDKLKQRRTRYAEYWYLPGLGVYGFGLLHMIGSLQEAATDALRAMLDSATFANMQGGFKAKDAAAKSGEVALSPGVWKDVDMTAEELSKAFYTPPFKQPAPALFQTLGLLTELGRRFSSTTDLMVGEGSKGPVGTTIAMIEQGQKVYSSVHKRGHAAVGVELRMLFDLNAEHVPHEGYPYAVPGDDLVVYKADYDTTMVGVVPVSDPNIFSQTQRIAQGQALYQLAKENPADFKRHKVLKRVLESLKTPDIDDVLIDVEKVEPMDPVTENIAMATQRPVKAHDGENHTAHLAVHMAFAQHPQFGGLPQAQQLLMPAMIAHIAEHVALLYADRQRQLGVPVPPIDLTKGPGEGITDPQNPQVSDLIAQKATVMIGQFMQMSGFSTPPAQQGLSPEARLTEAQAFGAFAAGVLNLAKAGSTVLEGEAQLAGLDAALNTLKPNNPNQLPPGAPGAPPGPPGGPPAPQAGPQAASAAGPGPQAQGGALPPLGPQPGGRM
jgi:hypothetical protein